MSDQHSEQLEREFLEGLRYEDKYPVLAHEFEMLLEKTQRLEEQNETLRQALHDVIYTPAGYESKLAWDRAIALVSNPATSPNDREDNPDYPFRDSTWDEPDPAREPESIEFYDGDPIPGRPGWFWSDSSGRPIWLGESSPASERWVKATDPNDPSRDALRPASSPAINLPEVLAEADADLAAGRARLASEVFEELGLNDDSDPASSPSAHEVWSRAERKRKSSEGR